MPPIAPRLAIHSRREEKSSETLAEDSQASERSELPNPEGYYDRILVHDSLEQTQKSLEQYVFGDEIGKEEVSRETVVESRAGAVTTEAERRVGQVPNREEQLTTNVIPAPETMEVDDSTAAKRDRDDESKI